MQIDQPHPLQGSMLEADFEKGTITFQMHGHYYARAGTYIILPKDEYDRLAALEPQGDSTK